MAPSDARAEAVTRVFINGIATPVSFNDGDSFRPQAGDYTGTQCRLGGFNSLESFGAAHQWGTFHPYELYVLAKRATRNGRRGVWHCTTDGARDTYGRLLMECPDLAVDQIRKGLAMAMQVDDTPARPAYLRAQEEAIAARRGIWAHGVPELVLTSLHSGGEDPSRTSHYNRLVSTRDGHSEKMEHTDSYDVCQWVCNTERVVDPTQVANAARALRADPELAPILATFGNVVLEEFASRWVRTGELPAYLEEPAQTAVAARLRAMTQEETLGRYEDRRGACMLYVPFARWYGEDRASCLTGHGTEPPP